MGLKCSLVGHDLGAPETERDREERGDEVVVTIREVRRCNRCDAERVVSESTEVRPVRSAPDSVAGEDTDTDGDGEAGGSTGDTAAADTGADTDTGSEAGSSATTGPAEPADGPPDPAESPEPAVERVAGEGPDPTGDQEPVGDAEAAADPETDDAVILEDDEPEPEPERDPGEWPDAEDTRLEDDEPATPTAEAVREATDEAGSGGHAPTDGPEAESESDADADPDAADQPDLGSGAWPDPQDGADEGYDATAPGDGAADTDDDGEMIAAAEGDAGGAVEAGGGSTAAAGAGPAPAAGVLVCPSCGFEEPSRGSSHRGGDVCPDCKRGYLSERSA